MRRIGTGDTCKTIAKYLDPGIRLMELPGNLEEDYDRGIEVTVKADPKKGVYIAYCAEFDEEIEFSARREVDGQRDQTGGNCRGYSVLKNFQPHTAKSLILRISCFVEKF